MFEKVELTPSIAYYWKSLITVGFLFFVSYKAFNEEPILGIFLGLPLINLLVLTFIRKRESKFTVDEEKISQQVSRKQTNVLSLSNVDKIEVHHSLLQQLLNIGNLNFYPSFSDAPKVIFYGIPNPIKWKSIFEDLINNLQDEVMEAEMNNSTVRQMLKQATESSKENTREKLYKSKDILCYSKPYSSFTLHCCFIDNEIETSTAFRETVNYIDEINDNISKEGKSPVISRKYYRKGYLTWLVKVKYLVNKLEKVKEGQELFELWIELYDGLISNSLKYIHGYHHITVQSPCAGFFEPISSIRERRRFFVGFVIYDNVKSYQSHRFNNKYQKSADSFSKDVTFYWSAIGSPSNELFNAMELCNKTHGEMTTIQLNKYLSFKPINKNGLDYICFEFNYRNMDLKAGDVISFLLSGEDIIEFELPNNMETIDPNKKKSINVNISVGEVQKLSQYELITVRVHQKSINYKFDISIDEYLSSWIFSKKNKQFVINGLFSSHFVEAQKQVENYKAINSIEYVESDDKEKEYCHVYLMLDTANNFYKIGISNNPEYRERTLQSEKPTIELICSKEFPIRSIAENMEKTLHKSFADKRIRGEWFELSDKDVEYIKQTLA